MEVGLVNIAALCRNHDDAMARGKTVGRMIETDEPGCALGSETDLRYKTRPQTLAAPFNPSRKALNPNSPAGGYYLPPGERYFGIDRSAGVVSSCQRSFRNREPVFPRPGSAQQLLDTLSITTPEVIKSDNHSTGLRRCAQHSMRDHR
jgi:hypothetical protein